MEHIDSTATRSSLSSRFSPSAHRGAWFSALAVGVIGCFAIAWGSPSRASSDDDTSTFASDCAAGDAIGCNNLGVSYVHGHGVSANGTLAFEAFERSCKDGSPDGCSNLGALYEQGVGTSVNSSEAARLYEQACSGGAALGCSNLGALYARGQGVARDRSEARRLFQLACDGGSAAGCSNLIQTQR